MRKKDSVQASERAIDMRTDVGNWVVLYFPCLLFLSLLWDLSGHITLLGTQPTFVVFLFFCPWFTTSTWP